MYYLHDEPCCLRFTLIQQLDSDELRDLEGCWRTVESIRRGKPLTVDIRRLTWIDEQTRVVLQKLRQAGANIVGEPERGWDRWKEPGAIRAAGAASIVARLWRFLVKRATTNRAVNTRPDLT